RGHPPTRARLLFARARQALPAAAQERPAEPLALSRRITLPICLRGRARALVLAATRLPGYSARAIRPAGSRARVRHGEVVRAALYHFVRASGGAAGRSPRKAVRDGGTSDDGRPHAPAQAAGGRTAADLDVRDGPPAGAVPARRAPSPRVRPAWALSPRAFPLSTSGRSSPASATFHGLRGRSEPPAAKSDSSTSSAIA